VATSPTVRQRELGKRLRELRNRHGLTVEDVGEKLLCSATKVSRLETGARRPSLRDVRDLCELYAVDEPTSAELMSLTREARKQEWWTQYTDLNLDPLLGLEQDATAITSYSMYYVPALLQSEQYTRAIIKAIAPEMNPEIYEQRVKVRMRRQELVLDKENRPRYRVLVDESVLRRRVGGPQVMAAQMAKILQSERAGKVTVQVVSFDVGAHAAQDSNFILFELGESPDLSPVVFVEGLTGNHYLEKPEQIARYREAIEYLRDSALSPRDSIQLVAELQRAYTQPSAESSS
jgi:transcriptional regulator with XRE-family HTH domain